MTAVDIATESQTERIVRLALALGRANRVVAAVRDHATFCTDSCCPLCEALATHNGSRPTPEETPDA